MFFVFGCQKFHPRQKKFTFIKRHWHEKITVVSNYCFEIIFSAINPVEYPEFFFGGGSTNSVDRGQRERGSGGGSP
jgi:hypothetical protein